MSCFPLGSIPRIISCIVGFGTKRPSHFVVILSSGYFRSLELYGNIKFFAIPPPRAVETHALKFSVEGSPANFARKNPVIFSATFSGGRP